jgi:hypothetical protein
MKWYTWTYDKEIKSRFPQNAGTFCELPATGPRRTALVHRFSRETNRVIQTGRKDLYTVHLKHRQPLWSSGQSSWLRTQRSRVRFPALPNFLSAVSLERGPLSLVRTNEKLLERKVALRSINLRLTTVGDLPRWTRDTPLSAKVGNKFRRQVAVAQSVLIACGLKATVFVCCLYLKHHQ